MAKVKDPVSSIVVLQNFHSNFIFSRRNREIIWEDGERKA